MLASFISTIIYLIFLAGVTHIIRSVNYKQYEAVTFQCSIITVVISYLQIVEHGINWLSLGVFLLFLLMFIINAHSQHKYYMKLQTCISDGYKYRTDILDDDTKKKIINENLLPLSSAAILPSFSRFIEESELFNNPGDFIGLTKSVMGRKRFQKNKYIMREKFAECISYIGPCKATIEDTKDDKKIEDGTSKKDKIKVSDSVYPYKLALDTNDEKWGLFDFDMSGFGAFILLILAVAFGNADSDFFPAAIGIKIPFFVHIIVLIVLIYLTHVLRIIAFGRYESIYYEVVFISFIVASYMYFRSYKTIFAGFIKPLNAWSFISTGILIVFFVFLLVVCLINKSKDKKLRKKIDNFYRFLIRRISYENNYEKETLRTKKKFLENLRQISKLAINPNFLEPAKITMAIVNLLTKSDNLNDVEKKGKKKKDIHIFEDLIREKYKAPERMVTLINELKPLYGLKAQDGLKKDIKDSNIEIADNEFKSENLKLDPKDIKSGAVATRIMGIIGLLLLIGLCVIKMLDLLPIF